MIGSLLSQDFRAAMASLLAVGAIIMGGLELGGCRIRILQCDRETPQRWVHKGALRWAAQNGLALGCGATSRLGFWLWYSVPAGALLVGRPELGAAIYGTYGLIRGMAVWIIILTMTHSPKIDFADWLITRNPIAHRLAAAELMLLGLIVVVTIGL